MEFVIFAALGSCAALALWPLRRPAPRTSALPRAADRTHDAVLARSPTRITRPSHANRPEVQAWILRASPACELTHSLLDGRRYTAAEAPTLPTIGCRLTDCHCRYDAVLSARRRERRTQDERRGTFRFGTGGDRRQRCERRDAGWGSTQVR